MKKMLIILGALGIVFFLYFSEKEKPKASQTCFNNHCYNLEIAKTPEARERGLMFRKNLDENSGMLFVFDQEGYYSFWMKDTLIPLDIIWLNEKGEVVFLSENVQPCQTDPCPLITPIHPAKFVLELNSGEIKNIGLKQGLLLELPE